NKPEAIKLFEFLYSLLKLPDWHVLGGQVLNDATKESEKTILSTLKEDPIGITLTFDGVVIITSEGRPYVWKAMDISLKYETHINIIEKINLMFTELSAQSIKAIAVITNSAGAYATA
ncbi:11901_t:CDS:2, partial [Racocetra persica]